MLDFLIITEREGKRGVTEVVPDYQVRKSSDLMIKGHGFYAIYNKDSGFWSTDEDDAIQLIDSQVDEYAREQREKHPDRVYKVLHLRTASTRLIQKFHTYCEEDMQDHYILLDQKFRFLDDKVKKSDHLTKRLPYNLVEGPTPGYDRIMSVLYSPSELHKIEWMTGAALVGATRDRLHKSLYYYGSGGTGKSTAINIQKLIFGGEGEDDPRFWIAFSAKKLGAGSEFAASVFKDGPLVAIDSESDLSRIEDNAALNSIISHDEIVVNEKFRSLYPARFGCFLIMASNKPVKITDARSGLIRRIIDVTPTGNTLKRSEYDRLMDQVKFEVGAIAKRCIDVYEADPNYYDDYIPYSMITASNDFYNFVADNYIVLSQEGGISSRAAYEEYKKWCDATNSFQNKKTVFDEELKAYYDKFEERHTNADGTRTRSWYSEFKKDKIEGLEEDPKPRLDEPGPVQLYTLTFDSEKSALDELLKDCPAQYASTTEKPLKPWNSVSTTLSQINTRKLHYVRGPRNLIFIDFDIPDENGNKSFERNLEAASKFPPTYAELSKSGKGIHLYYIYEGDVDKLAYLYDDHIEIKVTTGLSSIRRKLTKCNSLAVAIIGAAGLPLKGEKPVVKGNVIKTAASLQRFIVNCLHKKYEPHATKPSVEFIYSKLEEAYASGMVYDVTNMREAIRNFAMDSTHNADYCLRLVNRMKFKSKDEAPQTDADERTIVIFDVEIFPNLFLLCWKPLGPENKTIVWFNPSPEQVKSIFKYRLVGFNNRRYDNHILWAAGVCEFTPMQLYLLSQRIISGDKEAFFRDAYNLSYTDIYDFSALKQSLKRFEIDLKIDHKELGMKWDEPVPEDRWDEVAEYCVNDVVSTEAVWFARQGDFAARKILAALAGGTVNDTTNTLTTRIIFGDDKNPQSQFNYRSMGDTSTLDLNPPDDEYTLFDRHGRAVFKGYTYSAGVSTYRGEEVGEGGYVYSEPGMYGHVALLDIASMHPHSIIAEQLFGPKYTQRFQDLVNARIAIKHLDFEHAATMLDGALAPFLSEELAKDLAQALKIAINSVYGLTAAKFPNAFRDPRNSDNIVAKRGALFMVNLKHEVQKRGFKVAHIKTDSIKIPDATPEIISFVMEYGEQYGYHFEHEATYDRMCLVNDAVYIAKYDNGEWTATGTQFQVPYVFKQLFSREPIEFEDLCETKSVTSAIYLDFNEDKPDGEHNYIFVGKVGKFSPVKDGCGGGLLMRQGKDEGSYAAVTGTKGYRWKESEVLKTLGLEDQVNTKYYENLLVDAIADISIYGDYAWFISDDPYVGPEFVDGHPVYPDAVQIN